MEPEKKDGTVNVCSGVARSVVLRALEMTLSFWAHHTLLSKVFVCTTLLCADEIRAFGKSASSSLTFLQRGERRRGLQLEKGRNPGQQKHLSKLELHTVKVGYSQ